MAQTKINIIEGMEHFLNRYENNKSDQDIIDWTARSLFYYLNDYFTLSNIKVTQLDSLRDEKGRLYYTNDTFKQMAVVTYRIFINASNYELDNQFIKLCEKSLIMFLSHFLCSTDGILFVNLIIKLI